MVEHKGTKKLKAIDKKKKIPLLIINYYYYLLSYNCVNDYKLIRYVVTTPYMWYGAALCPFATVLVHI